MSTSAQAELKIIINIVKNSQDVLTNMLSGLQQLVTLLKTPMKFDSPLSKADVEGVSAFIDKIQEARAHVQALSGDTSKVSDHTTTLAHRGTDDLEKVRKKTQETSKEFQFFGFNVDKVTNYIRFLAGGFLALETVRFVKDIADTAARTEVLGTVLHVVGNNAGYTDEKLDSLDHQVQALGITATASRQALTQMIQAGLDPAIAAGEHGLARAAQDLAVIGGINSSEAFERLITSIERGYTQGLRYLGVVVTTEQAQQRYANSINKSVGELSAQEKVQALANEVLRKAGELTGTYEKAMGDVGKQLTSLPRFTEELATATGQRLLPVYRVLIQEYTLLLESLTDIEKAQTSATGSSDALAESVQSIARDISLIIQFAAKHEDAILNIVKAWLAWRAVLVIFHGVEGLAGIPKRLGDIVSGVKSAVDWFRSFTLVTEASTVATEAQTGALGGLAVAQEATVASGAAAAGSMAATEAAATGATTAIGLTVAAWASLAALLAVPIIAYVTIRRQQEASLTNDPAFKAFQDIQNRGFFARAVGNQLVDSVTVFERWKKENPELIAALQGRPDFVQEYSPIGKGGIAGTVWDEFTKQYNTYLATLKNGEDLKALQTQRGEVERLETQFKNLAASATAGERAILKATLEAARAEKTRLEEKLKGAADVESTLNRLVESRADALDAKTAVENLSTHAHTDEQAKAAVDAMKDANAKVKKLNAEFEETLSKDFRTEQERQAQRDKADANLVKRQAERRQEQLELGESKLFSSFSFTEKEGPTDRKFTEDLGYFRDQMNALGTEGDNVRERMDKLRTALRLVRDQTKNPQDLLNLTKALNEYQQKLTTVFSKVPSQDLAQIRNAIETGRLNVRDTLLGQNAKVTGESREVLKAQQALIQQGFEDQLAATKVFNASDEALDKERYKENEISLEQYYDHRRERIKSETDAEAALLRNQIEATQKELDRFKGQLKPAEIDALKQRINAEASKLRLLTEGGASSDLHPEGTLSEEDQKLQQNEIERRAAQKSATDRVIALEQQVDVIYGDQAATIAQITRKYQEQEKTLGQVKGAHQAIIDIIQAESAKAELDQQNKAIARQLDLQRSILDLERARINAGVQAGTVTTTESLRREQALAEKELALVDQQIRFREAQLQYLIALRGKRAEQIRAEDIEAKKTEVEIEADITHGVATLTTQINDTEKELNGLHTQALSTLSAINTYGTQLRRVFSDSLGTAINDTINDLKHAGNAVITLGNAIKQQITGTISKDLAERITKLITTTSSQKNGKGEVIPGTSLFDRLFNSIGLGTGPTKPELGSSPAHRSYTEVVNLPKTGVSTTEHFLPNVPQVGSLFQIGQLLARIFSSQNFSSGAGSSGISGPVPGLPVVPGAFEHGGRLSGPGTGTSDSFLANVSNGEYVMPAKETEQWFPLLESIRSGSFEKMVRYATGGLVNLQSIAPRLGIPRHFAKGGEVTDGGASEVQPAPSVNLQLQLHPDTMNWTMREWLEREVARQNSRR